MAPESTSVPVPALMRPPPVDEMTADIERSAPAVVESSMAKLRFAAPSASLPEKVAPSGLLADE